jgi:hypothetical protein
MNFTCRHCNSLVVVPPGDRPPPWCSKCGADLKSDDPQFLALSATLESDRIPVPKTRPESKAERRPDEELAEAAAVAEPTHAPVTRAGEPDSITRWVLVAGAGLVLVAALLGAEAWTFARNGQTTGGRVVVVMRAESLAFAMYRSEKVIEYEVGGTKYDIPAGRLEEGERVSLIYQANDPRDARINATMALYRWPLLLGAGGLMLLISGLVLTGLASERPTRPAPLPADAS